MANEIKSFFTIQNNVQAEIVEKKSKFIANLFYIESIEEAEEIIKKTKKRYFDARHNCIAYRVIENNQILERFSDDGEPSGTAGRPMLDVILGEDIYNVAVVVTRYFGGVLLGTGGLVRAYSKAVQEGLAASRVILKKKGISMKITTDYTGIGKIQYIAGERKLPILDSEYTEKVMMKLLVPVQDVESVQKAITEGTNGRAVIEKDQELYYALLDGQVMTFEH